MEPDNRVRSLVVINYRIILQRERERAAVSIDRVVSGRRDSRTKIIMLVLVCGVRARLRLAYTPKRDQPRKQAARERARGRQSRLSPPS